MNRSFGIEEWKLIENSKETAEEGTIIVMVWQMQVVQIRFSLGAPLSVTGGRLLLGLMRVCVWVF